MGSDVAALRALGLTEYAARAYAALVSLGPSPAAPVALAGRVPRTKVYAVLKELRQAGWVDVEEGRPRIFRARRPQECFTRERARVDNLLAEGLSILERQYADRSRRFGGPLWILDGEEVVAQRQREMLAGARRDVLLVLSFPLRGDDALAREVRAATRQGVTVRILVRDPGSPLAVRLARAGAAVRRAVVPPRFLLVDGREALIMIHAGDDVRAIWNPSRHLLEIMGFAVEDLWRGGVEPSARR